MPTSAITKNNAGIVEAIKRKSGSTKFYKPSFEGIIEAILDWNGSGSGDGSGTGGGGATVLPIGGTPPSTGNTDGDMVIIPNADGDYFIYVFANGAWEKINVTTEEVLPSGSAPMAITAPDGTVLSNQKDINNYLDKLIKELQELEGYDDAAIRKLIEDLQKEVDALPVTVADKAPDGEDGDLWFDTTGDDLQLFVSYEGEWVVASPPVSTEDIENSILEIQEILQAADALAIQRGRQIAELQSKIYSVAAGVVAVEDRLGKVTLDEAVNNGNIATLPIAIETEQGVSVLEDQALRITHRNNPYIRLVDEADFDALEVSLNNDHGHIDLSNLDDELHFKFAGQEKVVFKGKGDAEFKGRVEVEPGRNGREAVTFDQLVQLETEIEQLKNSVERGVWDFKKDESPNKGKYGLIQEYLDEDAQEAMCEEERVQCSLDADGDASKLSACNREFNKCMEKVDGGKWLLTDDWEKAEQIAFHEEDDNDVIHSFDNVKVGMYIDVYNLKGDGFMVARIDAIYEGLEGVRFKITPIKSRGEADDEAAVKFFSMSEEGEVELANYLRKDGDTMQGYLTIDRPRSGSNANSFIIRGRVGGVETSLFKDYQRKTTDSPMDDYIEYFGDSPNAKSIINVGWTDEHLVGRKGTQKMGGELQIINESRAECLYLHGKKSTATIMYVQGEENKTLFRVKGDGKVQAGTDANHAFMASASHDLVTKKYLDTNAVAAGKKGLKITVDGGVYYIEGA